MNGVDEAIIERADELVLLSARGEDLIAVCANMSTEEQATLQRAVSAKRSPIEQLLI